jgi:EAL and modified HD-GYP domain-containing signal transduction protein
MGLARDPNVSDQQLTDVIAIDPVLTFQLLRLVNSAALGGRGVASIGQALRLIGRGAFLRWLAVAVAAARKSKNGIDLELVRQAVERGRLCEQLVGTGRDAGTLFLVGLFSLLDVVFRMPLAEILERVVLSTEANDALLERTGPYADAITFAESYELGLFENAAGIAREMGVDPAKAGEFYTNAITWTAEALGAVLDSQAAMPVKKAS